MNIFITGGTSGIGLALAIEYLRDQNNFVAICGRDITKVPKELFVKHKNLRAYEVDVLDLTKLKNAVDDFLENHSKKLDLVIASAGRSVGKKSRLPDFVATRDVLNINIVGVVNTFEVALEKMLQQRSGTVAVIASVAGFVGLPGAAAYSASKAAVLKICESYSIDLKKENIDVIAIAPGFIDTPLTKKNDHPMPFMMSAEQSARLIIRAIDKKKKLYIFPWQMKLVITFLDKCPRCFYRFLMTRKLFNYSKH